MEATGEEDDKSMPVQKNFPVAVMQMREIDISVAADSKKVVKEVIMGVVRAFPFLGRERMILTDGPERRIRRPSVWFGMGVHSSFFVGA